MFVGKVFYKRNARLINKLQSTLFDVISSDVFQKKMYYFNYLDSLTGLKNKKCLETELKYRMVRGTSFDLFFLDIDNFKKINDQYGHIIGTKVLEAFSLELKKKLPKESIVFRYGGDEFVILITSNGAKIIESRNTFNNIETIVDGKLFKLINSVGKYRWVGEKISPEEILKIADLRMYQQKNNKVL